MDTAHADTDELQRLREENAALREQLGDSPRGEQAHGRWRWPVAVTLLIIGSVLLIASTVAVWSGRTIIDSDRYVETVTPLIDSPAIRSSIAERATDGIFESVDIEAQAREALPPRADFLAPSLATNLETYARTAAEDLLATPQARDLWVNANRRSHERIMPALLGEAQSPFVDVSEGTVSLDISGIVAEVKNRLASSGITIVEQIPDDALGSSMTVLQSQALADVQAGLRFLQGAMLWLPAITVITLLGAVVVSPDRRRASLWLGIGTILAMLVLAAGVAMLRQYYVASDERLVLDAAAASVLFDTLFRFLRNAIRVIAAIGLMVTVVAALAGPSRLAVEVRRTATDGAGSVSRLAGLDLGRFSVWVDRHRRSLDVVGVLTIGLVLLAVSTPTPALVLGLAIGFAVWILAVEVLARAHGQSTGT